MDISTWDIFNTCLHASPFPLCACSGYRCRLGATDHGSCPGSGFIPFSGYSCSPQPNSCHPSIRIIHAPLSLSLSFLQPEIPLLCFGLFFLFFFYIWLLPCPGSGVSSKPWEENRISPSTKQTSLKTFVINNPAVPEIVLLMEVKDDLGKWSKV